MTIEARLKIDRGPFCLDVELNISGEGVSGIFGPSGCGKTTLLRAIAGLERTADGFIRINDMVWQSPGWFLPPHRRPIGYVFQEPSLFAHLDVRRNLVYGRKRLGKWQPRLSLERAIDLLGIEPILHRRPDQLSGGEQQRVAIARALALSPAILLLDEPLAGLDEPRKQEILPYLESLHRELEIPVVYVSHSRREVARLADHLVLLREGKVQAVGPVTEIFSRLDLPLAHDPDTETVIAGTVAAHDDEYGLSLVDFGDGRIAITGEKMPLGKSVRLQILARDVSLALDAPNRTSILNILPATVDGLAEDDAVQVTVRLKVGSTPLLCRVTRKSAEELGLEPGLRVFAQVKSVALLV